MMFHATSPGSIHPRATHIKRRLSVSVSVSVATTAVVIPGHTLRTCTRTRSTSSSKRRRRRPRRSDIPSSTIRAPSGMLTSCHPSRNRTTNPRNPGVRPPRCSRTRPRTSQPSSSCHSVVLVASSRLILVLWVFALMMQLLFLGQLLPLFLVLVRFSPPLLADDLGDLRVGEAGVFGHDAGLVVLAVEDECCFEQKGGC